MRETSHRDQIQCVPVRAGRMAVLLLTLLATSCASHPTLREIAPEINATLTSGPLFLLPDDRIEVRFPSKPEWNHEATVRRDGRAAFLFVEEFLVAGKTMADVDKMLREAYQKQGVLEARVDQAPLTLNLVGVGVRRAVVMGEVGSPGPVELAGGHLTLLEAIGKAGGPNKATADLADTYLIRWLPAEQKVRTWRIDARLDYWLSGTPILLQAHDVVFIPNNTIDKVNIWVDKYIRQNLPIPLGIPVLN